MVSSPVRPYALADLPILTGRQAADFDALAMGEMGVPEAALMERAGTGAATLVMEVAPRGAILVLVGKGNNGGDALVVARCLRAWGRDVELLLTAHRPGSEPLLHGWDLPIRKAAEMDGAHLSSLLAGALSGEGAVVDGVLGTGITGAPRGEAERVLSLLQAARDASSGDTRLVALDIPSGVDADTGDAPGAVAAADVTVSFGWPKLGTLLHPGRGYAGRQVTLEIGFPPLPASVPAARLLTPAWARAHRPIRSPVTHKNRVGAVAVVAGRPGMAGAAVLSARAALRAGAGYVRVVSHDANREIVQSALPEAVFVDASDPGAVADALAASRAVAVGPGMGTDPQAVALLARVLEADIPRVVDADALTLLSASPDLRRAAAHPGTVVTPHPGEAARLLGRGAPESSRDRLEAVQELREAMGAVVLLKGTPSLVLGPRGLLVDAVGSSDLAVAGMGDTLTGAIASFLGQGVSATEAAGLGLVVTGRAAARSGMGPGLQAADVPEHLPQALAEGAGETDLRLPGVLLDLDPAR